MTFYGISQHCAYCRSEEKERLYAQACNDLVQLKKFVSASFCTIIGLKDKNPWLYMAAITVSLSTLAWLGNQMHNLLLTYFISKLIALLLSDMWYNHISIIVKHYCIS